MKIKFNAKLYPAKDLKKSKLKIKKDLLKVSFFSPTINCIEARNKKTRTKSAFSAIATRVET